MKSKLLTFLSLFLFALPVLGQATVTTKPIEGILANSASILSLQNKVAVILQGAESTKRQGLEISVATEFKYVTARARYQDFRKVPVHKTESGTFVIFGPSGKYELELNLFDPGSVTYDTDIFIGVSEPTDPDKPPIGGFEDLKVVAKKSSAALNDPKTAKSLAEAYRSVLPTMQGKTLEECKLIAITARRKVLTYRTGESKLKNWDSFLAIVDKELLKVAISPETYQAALVVVSEAIDPS